jgi:predicted DNA-binding protein (MmcQ/YjbR family)
VDIQQAVRDACLWLPEAEEFISHGAPNFRVRGKTFATYAVNHHGDGRVALWLNALPGSQEQHVRAQPRHFFVPPYVGPRGWLGVVLDRGLEWARIVALVREAYEKTASPALRARVGATPALETPSKAPSAAEIDPWKSPRGLSVLKSFRHICLSLPGTLEERQFGHPVWRAGKKTFASARHDAGRLTLCFWVGVDQQGLLTDDPRFQIPAYTGHNGWIALDVDAHGDWEEIKALTLQSYRHFALKRLLAQLPAERQRD